MTRIRLCDLAWPSFLRTPRARSRPLYLFITLLPLPLLSGSLSALFPSHPRLFDPHATTPHTVSVSGLLLARKRSPLVASEGNNNNYGGRDRFASQRTKKIPISPEEITAEMCKIKDRWRTRRGKKKKYISNIGRLLYTYT